MDGKQNVQARWKGAKWWKDFGSCTLEEGAVAHCRFFGRDGIVETRWESKPDVVFEIEVSKSVEYVARCRRND